MAFLQIRNLPPSVTTDARRRESRRAPTPLSVWLGRVWKQLAIYTNWPALAAIGVLTAIGLISIWADARADVSKQLTFLGVAVVGMALFQAINYQMLGRLAWGFYIFSLLLILYTVAGGVMTLPGVRRTNGATAWIYFGSTSFQPAELMKLAFIMVMARYLRFRSNYRTVRGLLAPFALAGVPLLLILKQPDLGTALVFIPVLFAMLFVAGAKLKHLLPIVGTAIVLAPLVWMSGTDVPFFRHFPAIIKGYQRERVLAMFSHDPRTLRGTGFQQEHAMTALGSGGVAGKGFGVIPVGQIVPEAHNDMIFSIIGEQFGFFGTTAVLVAYIVLFASGIEIAANNRDPFGRLVAIGIIVMFAGQAFINIMVTLRLMPVTGITLPFVSYGGTSLLASYMAAGLLLNIGQHRPLVMARDSFDFDE
ncbi:FtsW/RodA/SpoVE family cell cycle protein [Humisphaera borealis]|uniref:Cell wall polymerase n=1 Tax=Humisphaera borealis TaxID=2807512 RepID=A0A7M2X440_9BACT|nr:FtsW/RodA/SpoVE family cell cycle protein [Humisphaera borealis]QOV91801.1 rod shape-determining protein RodA [Humisphaera borealis]